MRADVQVTGSIKKVSVAIYRVLLLSLALLHITACSDKTQIHRTVEAVGPQKLRNETMAVCREKFPRSAAVKIVEAEWPPTVRAFRPLSLWAEPDGAYILLDSDADGERGVFLPRVISEKDPICGPKLLHVKLADGVYWYERKR
jgi:hypothetical protein